MLSVRRWLGLIVLVLGVIILVLAFTVLNSSSLTVPDAKGGSFATFTPQIVGGGTLTLTWSGANDGTVVTVLSCGDASCSSGGGKVASGGGASGSLSFSVSGYHTYAVIANTNNSSSGVAVTASVVGLSWLGIIGILLAGVGAILFAIPAKAPAAAPVEEEPEEEQVQVMGSSAPAESRDLAATTDGTAADASAAGTAAGRPSVKCPHCGTMNEPWITNCRWCKRPMSSTNK